MNDSLFACLKMPHYDGDEPTEIDLKRIEKFLQEGRFDELSRQHQRWVTRRFLPSLTRFGVYPPPKGSSTHEE